MTSTPRVSCTQRAKRVIVAASTRSALGVHRTSGSGLPMPAHSFTRPGAPASPRVDSVPPRHGRHVAALRRRRRAGPRSSAPGRSSARELVEATLERIARLDPAAQRLPRRARRARARRGRPGRRAPPRAATTARCSACRSRSRTTSTSPASRRPGAPPPTPGPSARDAEVVRRLRAAGAVIVGKTHVPEMTMLPATETTTFGSTRNPWDLEPHARRLERRQRGGDRRRPVRRRARLRRRRLDPRPVRLVRAVRPQAPARPRPARAARRRLAGAVGQRPDRPHASPTRRCSSTRRSPTRRRAASSRPPRRGASRQRLRIAVSSKAPPGALARLGARGAPRGRGDRRAAARARPRGRRARPRLPGRRCGAPPTCGVLRGIHDDVAASMPHPERLERRTRRIARSAARFPAGLVRWAREAEAGQARAAAARSSTTSTSC